MPKQPLFSVIIPTYNRPERLATCLNSLVRLKYPRDRFEVIVVDDGSPTSPAAIVAAYEKQIDIRLITQINAGPATARNTGTEQAKGEFLAFTDDDCAPDANWLSALAHQFANAPDAAIGGHTLNALSDNSYSTASQLLIDYLYSYYNAEPSGARFFTSNNLAVPAVRLSQIGGFDTTFPMAAAEDRELCDRWLHCGYQLVFAPKAIVCHAHPLTFSSFFRQHLSYGRGAYCYHQVRAKRNQAPIEIEGRRFYLNLLCYPFAQAHKQHAFRLAALLFVSQIANAMGFYRAKAGG